VAPIARLHPASATLPTANVARIGHHRQSRWDVETIVARCDEQLLLGVPMVGATRRLLNFFGRASGRSCRTYPLWDRLLWQSSIRRALSTPRRNDRGSIRFHVPIDASVDVTDARKNSAEQAMTADPACVDRLVPRLGDASLAAEVQLLKPELVRGHAIFSTRPEDNN